MRIRVIAVDRRFQNSSDGATRVFRLTSPPNAAPSVQVTFPANGASQPVGKAFFVAADASDSDGTIRRVEFYETTSQFGPTNTKFIGADATPPYQIGWTYPDAQTHTITARVIDDRNAVSVSAPVNVTVQPGNPAPLPIGLPELTNPVDGTRFNLGQNITLAALPAASSYSVVRVEFYNGTTLIASDNTAPYEIVWNNVPAGNYTVFAKTIAGNGAEAISKPADIRVGPDAPALTSAVSRKTHGVAGDFDIALPSSGTPGVEGRAAAAGGAHTLVFAFNNGIASGSASVSNGTGSVSNTSVSGNSFTVDLSGVADRQTITVTVNNITDAFGQTLPPFDLQVKLLLGDVTGNGAVNASDLGQVKANSGAPVNQANFRSDVIPTGMINSSDISAVKAASGATALTAARRE